MKAMMGLSMVVLGGCAATVAPPPPPAPATIQHPVLPTGARMIGTSTLLTIDEVPPSPTGGVERVRQTYSNETEFYAQSNGISLAEATRRIAEQAAMRDELHRLMALLPAREPGNYVGAEMIHQPDWGYRFYFKRDAAATLAKYSRNPRFTAVLAPYTEAELQAQAKPWIDRLHAEGALGGYGVSPIRGHIELMVAMDEAEYRALAAQRGWGEPPATVKMGFATALAHPAVDPRLAALIRGFAYERRSTTIQLTAGYSGRLVMDEGCLRLAGEKGKKGPLAVFHRETGLGLDAQGYVALIDRRSGKALGRVGEPLSWAGPNEAKDYVGLDALKAACGDGPIVNVGTPESQARFDARYPPQR